MALAQAVYRNYNTSAGLPSNESYCVFEDKDGYIWTATDHGILKYNGYTFTQFTTSNGLTDNTIFSIKQDNNGVIWVLTFTGGICYYDGQKFAPHPLNDTIKTLFSNRLPTTWEVLDNKTIWLGFVKEGIYRIDSNSCQSYLITPYVENRDTSRLVVVTLKNQRFVYAMVYSNAMNIMPGGEIADVKYYAVHSSALGFASLNFALVKLAANNILVCIGPKLVLLNDTGAIYDITWPRVNNITNTKILSDGSIWVPTLNTPAYLVTVNKGTIRIIDSLSLNASISDIILDRQGNYWLSTLNKGLYMVPNRTIRTYPVKLNAGGAKILSMATNGTDLYVGMEENALLKIDSTLRPSIAQPFKDNAGIYDITFTPDGRPFTNLDGAVWKNTWFYLAKIRRIRNDTYLSGGQGGFMIANDDSILFRSDAIGFNKRITALGVITPNIYAIGTVNGLYYFNNNSRTLVKENLLADSRVTSCRTVSDKIFAAATRAMGIYISINGRKFVIDETRGLTSNLVEDIFFENDSVCWAGTFKGISKIAFKLKGDSLYTRIHSYSQKDGLCSNQINAIAVSHGYIWIGSNEGLCYFKPDALREDTLTVPLYFTNIFVNGNKRPLDSLNLTYDENNILIEYNAMYYKALTGVRYKMRLRDVDNWEYTDRNSAQFLGLPAGEYIFEIMAEDKFGRYRSAVKSLSFTIQPRFTDTVLFKSMVTAALMLITAVIVYLIFTYQRLKSKNVIKLLQAEFKALNYQINPHFIFNVLNSIQYYIIRKDTDKAVHFLNSFSVLIRRIVINSRQQYASVIDEVECLKEYLDLEKLRLDNKFDYEINIDSSIDIEEKIILPMILQPLVENSIWHGIVPSENAGLIKIDFRKQGNALLCVVDDNGVGIKSTRAIKKKSTNNLSVAMSNVNERLKIISELNGSNWYIKFEDKGDLGTGETGTIVTILFPLKKKDDEKR